MSQLLKKEFLEESGGTVDLDNPKFDKASRVHDWRNYVPEVVCEEWFNLRLETRQAVYIMAKAQADNEEWD